MTDNLAPPSNSSLKTAPSNQSLPGRFGAIGAGTLTFLLLLPFLDKAFHIDDTLFLYTAKQILQAPLHPYDFTIIWFGFRQSMWEATMNPPLNAYLIAAWAKFFGFGEIGLHLLFAALAALCAAVVFRLSSRFVARPWIPTLFVVASPAFFVSATSVMADIPVLLLYASSILLMMEGLDRDRPTLLVTSGVLTGLAFLTKYQAFTAVFLLAVLIILRKRRVDRRLLYLVIPFLVAAPWAVMGIQEHGQFHFVDALLYKPLLQYRPALSFSARLIEFFPIGLIFVGAGALFVPLNLLPNALSSRNRAWLLLLYFVVVAPFLLSGGTRETWACALLLGLGVFVALYQMASSAYRSFSADRLVLFLWAAGVFVFLVAFNWTIAERVVLMMLPPVAIGVASSLEAHPTAWIRRWYPFGVIGLSLVLSLVLAYGDARFAGSYRDFARTGLEGLEIPASRVHFFGSWGFLYYMEQEGYSPVDLRGSGPRQGDYLVGNLNNMRIEVNRTYWVPVRSITYPNPVCLSTMNQDARAAFYSASELKPFPYVFSCLPHETITIYRFE